MVKTIAVLGTGAVGKTLARGLTDCGYEITLASRKGLGVDGWSGQVATFKDASNKADLIILAVKGIAAESVVSEIATEIKGKTVIDATNPIDNSPPDDGVLKFFTNLYSSLMERLQATVPDANFVKALNSVGSGLMVQPKFKEGKPTMFICGNNKDAKSDVSKILVNLGWEVEDMGGVKAARAIEPLCMLWCIPGMLSNQWSHAFKLLKN
jgi:predicted dinucleotide-binding enzyme